MNCRILLCKVSVNVKARGFWRKGQTAFFHRNLSTDQVLKNAEQEKRGVYIHTMTVYGSRKRKLYTTDIWDNYGVMGEE